MNRKGFTLIEMLMAVSLLGIVLASLGRFMGMFQKSVTVATSQTLATSVAQERLETIRADPRYTRLVNLYGTGGGADSTITPAPGLTIRRRTFISRDQSGAPARDVTTITVRVTSPGMKDTVNLTAVVAAP